jgi:ABC-type multidrug transport system ATPase subunit
MLAIQLQNVTKLFGEYKAVNKLNLEVTQGEIYGFLGPNGGGKSTTLRMILGLLKPDNGSIFIAGNSIATHRTKALSHVGCIIEKPDYYGYLTALQNMKLFARMHNINTKTYNFTKLLETVGLHNIENKNVKTFSHGMKQRLGLALALLHNPNIIILDEPNTGLDPQGIIDLRNLLSKLNKEEGKTILLSSHILSEIEAVADSMIVINKGETVAQGKVKDLLNNQQLHVLVETENIENALHILNISVWQKFISETEHNTIHFTIAENQIPELNTFFVQNNIRIYNLQKSRSLERYFLSLTQSI